eukprot:3064085-Rhodomonas_salina.3
MSGTDTACAATCLRTCYTVSGTHVAYAAICLHGLATRCPVLRQRYNGGLSGGCSTSKSSWPSSEC